MGTLLVTVRAAVFIFVGTSIEDFFGLTALFMSSRTTGRPRPWQIVTGWYTGIGFLVIVSAAAALGLVFVPQDWAGLLGIVPLTIGAVKLAGTIRAVRAVRTTGQGNPVQPVFATRVASIAALAISNGGDNIGVYVPTFRAIGPAQSAVMVAVFALCLGAWCFLASMLGSHKKVTAVMGPYGKWIIPFVYLTVGVVIIANSGIIGRLAAS